MAAASYTGIGEFATGEAAGQMISGPLQVVFAQASASWNIQIPPVAAANIQELPPAKISKIENILPEQLVLPPLPLAATSLYSIRMVSP